MDESMISLLCLVDLSKCFDVIDHKKLLLKLELHGIDTKWFENYLSGHTQSVCFSSSSHGNQTSSPRPIRQGVFQGSSLGPLLFTIFANDLSLHADGAFVIQYADDTQVLVSGSKSNFPYVIARMEQALASLDSYFRSCGLKVNESKFELLAIGSRQNLRGLPPFSVSFRDSLIHPCEQARNLGLTFDRSLSWDLHVSRLSQMCFGILVGVSHLRHYLPPSTLTTIVSALVFSHVRYCLTVYGNGSAKNLQTLQKILNFAARIISGRKKFDHISDVREDLGWLDAKDLFIAQTLTVLHKVRRSGEPQSLAAQFCLNCDLPGRIRSTRQDGLLSLPRGRGSAAGKRRFSYRAATMYNELPTEFRDMSVPAFKRALNQQLRLH